MGRSAISNEIAPRLRTRRLGDKEIEAAVTAESDSECEGAWCIEEDLVSEVPMLVFHRSPMLRTKVQPHQSRQRRKVTGNSEEQPEQV